MHRFQGLGCRHLAWGERHLIQPTTRGYSNYTNEVIEACIKVVEAMVVTSGRILDTFLKLTGLKID